MDNYRRRDGDGWDRDDDGWDRGSSRGRDGDAVSGRERGSRDNSRGSSRRGGGSGVPAYGTAYSTEGSSARGEDRRRGRSPRDRRGGSRDRSSRDRSRSRDERGGQRSDRPRGRGGGGGGWDTGDRGSRSKIGPIVGADRNAAAGGSGRGSFAAESSLHGAPLLPSARKKADWECSKCNTLNFARRDRCFGCGAAAGKGFRSTIPTNVLRVSGLRRSTTAEQVVLALKAFAPVKDAHLAVHPSTGASLLACYVEFQSVEHSQHTLETAARAVDGDDDDYDGGRGGGGGGGGGLMIEGEPASLSYAAAGAPPASAAAALAAASATKLEEEGEEEEGRVLAPVSASSLAALNAFQGRQNAARLAKLEGAEAAAGGAMAASVGGGASFPSPANSEAAAARARRARVDTGSGAGTGSLALAFAPGTGGGYDDFSSRGAMAVVTLGGVAGSEGASPEAVCAALQKKLNPPDWPPPFEEAGAAYLFDGPSGYFYESTTGVYYDPRSKLYCKGMVWYNHSPGQEPAFVPVLQQQEGTDQQNSLAKEAAGGVAVAGGASTSAHAVAAGAAATATNAGPTAPAKAAGGKRTGSGWKKSSRLAFGFKGAKLAKAGVGSSGVLGGAESNSSGDDDSEAAAGGKGGADPVGGGVGIGGAFAKKRQLEDMSKWNARKLEVHQGEGGDGNGVKAAAQPLHIAPRRQQLQQPTPQATVSYDPPVPLWPPLLPDEVPTPRVTSEAVRSLDREAGGVRDSGSGGRRSGGAGAGSRAGGGIEGRGVSVSPAVGGRGDPAAGESDPPAVGAGPVVVACLLCRRSFGSSEMLRKHEKKSKLHKDNLAAAAAAARGGMHPSEVAVGGGGR